MREDIWNDIYTLISLYEKADKDCEKARKELRQKEERLEEYKEQIKELEKKIDNLRLRNAFLSASGDGEAKEKIDRLIREIDKCIALLEG